MANLLKGQVEIELDRPRIMQYTLDSLLEIMDELGLGLEDMGRLEKAMFEVMRADKRMLVFFLWVGLKTDDPGLKQEETGRIIPATAMMDVWNAMLKALGAALPEPKKDSKPGNPRGAKANR